MLEELTPEEEAELVKYLPPFLCGSAREKLKTTDDVIRLARTLRDKIKKAETRDKD